MIKSKQTKNYFLWGYYKIFSIIDCGKSVVLNVIKNSKQALSIIELSVTVIVLSVLLSSIILSKKLIIISKASSVYADVNKFQTLISIFNSLYGCIPGDCSANQITTIAQKIPSACFNLQADRITASTSPLIGNFNSTIIDSPSKRSCLNLSIQDFADSNMGLGSLNLNSPTVVAAQASTVNAIQANIVALTTVKNAGLVQTYNTQMATLTANQPAILSANTNMATINGVFYDRIFTAIYGTTWGVNIPTNTTPPNLITGDANSPLNYGNYTYYKAMQAPYAQAQCGQNDCSNYNGNYNSINFAPTTTVINSLPATATNIIRGLNGSGADCGCTFYCDTNSDQCQYKILVNGSNCSLCIYTDSSHPINGSYNSYCLNNNCTVGPQGNFQLNLNAIISYIPSAETYTAAKNAATTLAAANGQTATNLLSSSSGATPANTTVVAASLNISPAVSALIGGCVPDATNNYCTDIATAALATQNLNLINAQNNAIALSVAGATNFLINSFSQSGMWDIRNVGSMSAVGFYPFEAGVGNLASLLKNNSLILVARNQTNFDLNATTDLSVFSSSFSQLIDTKYDDGKPYSGNIFAGQNVSQMGTATGCTNSVGANWTAVSSASASYLNNSNVATGCVLGFTLVV